jgi:hypothetical protein
MNVVGSFLIGLCVLRAAVQLALNYRRAVLFRILIWQIGTYVQQDRYPQDETFLARSRNRSKQGTVVHVVTIVTIVAELAIAMVKVKVKFSPSTS